MNVDSKVLRNFKKAYSEHPSVTLIGAVWHSFNAGLEYESCIIVYTKGTVNLQDFPVEYEGYPVIIQESFWDEI